MDDQQTQQAEEMLGMTDEDRATMRIMVAVDLLLTASGISEEQVVTAYRARLADEIRSAATNLLSTVGDR